MRLHLLHADVAARPCSDCKKYLYHDQGYGRFGPRVERGGKPVPRPRGVGTPCHFCPKIAPGDDPHPDNAQDLTPQNEQAYRHYLECRAVGEFPPDPLVRANAAVIRGAEAHAERVHQTNTGLLVLGQLFKRA